MPVICIHVESPPSSDAEPGTVTITGWQRLLWIGCLSCYLLGQQQRWPSMQLLLGLSHWQADVFRIPCTLVTKARPANRKPGASAPALLLPPPLLWVWVKLRLHCSGSGWNYVTVSFVSQGWGESWFCSSWELNSKKQWQESEKTLVLLSLCKGTMWSLTHLHVTQCSWVPILLTPSFYHFQTNHVGAYAVLAKILKIIIFL